MPGSYKTEMRKTDVAGAIGDAFGELQSLRDEMREWADNLENGNLGQTQKAQDVGACADSLDSVADDEPDYPEEVSGLEVGYGELVHRRKGRGPSRSVRRDNATAMLAAVIETLNGHVEDLDTDGKDEESEDQQELADKIEELVGDLQNVIDEAEGCEFPGMFG